MFIASQRIGQTHLRRVRLGLLPVLLLLLVLAAACGRVANPEGWAGGVVVDDVMYTGTMDGTLLAIDAATGGARWEFDSLGGEDERRYAFYGDPVVAEGRVFAAGYDGYLYAVSGEDGSKIWQSPVGTEVERIVGGPGYGDGMLVVGSSDGSVYAYDAENGTEQWSFPTDSVVWTTPLVEEGVVYFGSFDKHVYAISLADGRELWKTRVDGAVIAPAVTANGRLFVGALDGVFYALDAATGAEAWRFDGAGQWYWAAAAVTDTNVYAASLDGRIYALSLDRGEQIWRGPERPDGPIIGSPVTVGDLLVFASDGGTLWSLSLADGSNQRNCDVGEKLKTNLETSDGQVYLGASDHTVRALAIDRFGEFDETWVYKTDEPRSDTPISNQGSWQKGCGPK